MNTSAALFTRRSFARLTLLGSGLGGLASGWARAGLSGWDPAGPLVSLGRALRVQPVFMVQLPTRRAETSWRSWGGVQTEAEVREEMARIAGELEGLRGRVGVALEVQPVRRVGTVEEARAVGAEAADVRIVYACTGSGQVLRACLEGAPDKLVFVRHRSGPVYYWYEALSDRYLEGRDSGADAGVLGEGRVAHVDDVVVDAADELGWRLRALFARHNLRGTRVVALGGPWGKYSPDAPQLARDRFGLEIVDVGYEGFEPRLRAALEDTGRRAAAERATREYLRLPKTRLETERGFVVRAFVLHGLFRELMEEHGATAFTIKSCMGTIIPMSKTTACLTLGLLNDEGWMAFCESDFVIIPAGILMRYVSGRPVFLHNSTFPHAGAVTCAHCASPRRLDGRRYLPTRVMTHFESDYGAAPKVEIPRGQGVTFVDPDYSKPRWLGFRGTVQSNPDYAICRSQQDVVLEGDWQALRREARDSHWIMVLGDYLREAGYAARRLGLEWVTPTVG